MKRILFIIITFYFFSNTTSGQERDFLNGFKYVVVTPITHNDGSHDKYGIEKKAVQSINSIGLKCLSASDRNKWSDEALAEPCIVASVTIESGKLPNEWNCGSIRIIVRNCKNDIISNENVRSRNAICSYPYTCCYRKWAEAVYSYFSKIRYNYNPDLNKIKMFPEVEKTDETLESIKSYLTSNSINPIEGIYTSQQTESMYYYKLGIKKQGNMYIAVILEAERKSAWKRGEVKAYFEPTVIESTYSTKWYMENKTRYQTFAILKRNGLLSIDFKNPENGEKITSYFIKTFPISKTVVSSKKTTPQIVSRTSDIDRNIPKTDRINSNAFALIIGNEDYASFQHSLNSENNVPYAIKDATVFKRYVINTLGVPTRNITFLENATAGQMEQAISKLKLLAKYSNGKAVIFFYYAGHGLPDETTKESYLIPVDISGTYVKRGINLTELYNSLSEYPTEKNTFIIDACFSGGARNNALINTRGVKIKPKKTAVTGNTIVFASSSNSQSSMSYDDKGHGMFTYFFIKKLQETEGNCTYKEMLDYLKQKVPLESIIINEKEQDPNITASPDLGKDWENWNFLPSN